MGIKQHIVSLLQDHFRAIERRQDRIIELLETRVQQGIDSGEAQRRAIKMSELTSEILKPKIGCEGHPSGLDNIQYEPIHYPLPGDPETPYSKDINPMTPEDQKAVERWKDERHECQTEGAHAERFIDSATVLNLIADRDRLDWIESDPDHWRALRNFFYYNYEPNGIRNQIDKIKKEFEKCHE